MKGRLALLAPLVVGAGTALACLSNDSVMPPRSAPPRSRPIFSGIPIGRTVPVSEQGRMGLDRFAPFLARPRFAAVRVAIEEANYENAANELESLSSAAPGGPDDAARVQFLLGRLREKSGNLASAAGHFQLAKVEGFPLAGYARISRARTLFGLGEGDLARGELDALRADGPVGAEKDRLGANIDARLGKFDQSLDVLRRITDVAEPDTETLLKLAEVLLASASPSNSKFSGRGEAAGAAGEQGITPGGFNAAVTVERSREALKCVRRARSLAPDDSLVGKRARELEERARASLALQRAEFDPKPSLEERRLALSVMVQRRLFKQAAEEATLIESALTPRERFTQVGCEVALLHAKALAGTKDYSRATDLLTDPILMCKGDVDFRARLLYLAAKYGAAAGRHAFAARTYQQLEIEAPKHSLADDARLRAAQSYRKLGSDARFVELLSTILDDYPDGDSMLDGVFALALSRIENNDWPAAAATLERVYERAKTDDHGRGQEFAGRERYFSARAWIEGGELARGLAEYETIIDELPFSYYMLHAYSRLMELDPARAAGAQQRALLRAREHAFSFKDRPEYAAPGFVRAMELLGLGEVEWAKQEIVALGLDRPSASPGALWGVALMYDRAGAPGLAHNIARGLLTDWLEHWPGGDWEQAWRIAFPTPYAELVERESKRSGTPKFLTYAIMREESAFDPEATSPANAFGLMQLIIPTAKMVAQPLGLPYDSRSLFRPAINIRLGSQLLGTLMKDFKDNPLLAIPSYNAGASRAREWKKARPAVDFDVWVELIPFHETRRYVKRVLVSRAAYAWLYENSRANEALLLPRKLN
ncbi:MAG: transglycosylase SLT domain-containing protein [Polyangiaceae bacterium]|nr:transglycosylase SLT domain-containing protein [Polyangiaceae bacterium]